MPTTSTRDEREVDEPDERAVAAAHLVVRARLVAAAAPARPAPVDVEGADEGDDEDDRVGEGERERDDRAEADEPHPRRQRGHRAAAVERGHRQQVEEVQEEAGEGQRRATGRCPSPRRSAGTRRRRSVPRIGPARPTRASASALPPSDLAHTTRAQEGDEDRRAGLDALAAQRDDVAHLVDEEQHDEADGELPAPDQRVGGDRDEHRARGREDLELGQQQQDRLELGPDHDQRREQAAAGAPPPRTLRLAEGRRPLRPAGRAPPAAASRAEARGCAARSSHTEDRVRRCSSTSVTRACT